MTKIQAPQDLYNVSKLSPMIIGKKIGQTNFLTLNQASLRGLQDWLMQYHTYWGSEEETLENYAQYLGREHTKNKEKKK